MLLTAEQVEEPPLLGVVGARRVAERGADAAVALGGQVFGAQFLIRTVAPLATHTLVQHLCERLGQAVGQRAHHDGRIVVVVALEFVDEGIGAQPGRHGERAQVIR